MEVVGAVCGLVSSLLSPLKEQIYYVKNLKKNFTKLEEDVKALCNLKDDIEIARDTSKILSKECKGWTENVDKFETEVSKIKEEVDENRRCLKTICARRKVGKRVKTMLENVAELKKDADFKGAKYVDAPAAVVEEIPVPDIKGGETAVERTVKRIMQSIMDAKIKKIGLWGMGGVGKTTALKNLNNHSEIAQTFEVVIWVTVSKEGSVRKVQNEIAERLEMNIRQSEADERNARKLHEKLKSMKYLLLLDDLWSPVNLDDVGIPIQEGSKVVLTTRSLDVCRNMESDDEIKVECLSEEEAWDLFREKAGGVVDSPSIEPIAKDVAKECAGLPLAVVVTGKSLRKVEDVHVWQDALNQLKSATFQFGDTEAGLFERLKLSYDRLKEVEQSCFLYCGLYPEDHEIRVAELVERWRLEGFTSRSGMDRRLDDADDRGHTIVKNLVDASLVERTVDCVKMHDVLRDLALRIASSKFLVRAGLGIEECPYDEKEWEEAHRISLMDNKLSGGLPPNPRCNELSTLLLRGNENLEYIPDMFFQHMPSLRVLDLNWTGIKVVPASVSNLVNLRGLYASSQAPVDLPREIGALKKLEVLEVNVGSLPIEVRQLTSLRRLWVTFDENAEEDTEESMKTICSNGVISSLFQLEDLRIYFRDDFEDNVRREWCKVVDDSRVGEEVGRLKRLTRLEFDFSRIECLEHFLVERNTNSCPELKDFHLSMTSESTDGIPRFGQEMKKTLMWNEGERELSSEVKMSQIINQALSFQLTSHRTATSLLHLGMENIQRLEKCQVWDCPAMETIVESNGPSTSTTNVTPVLLNLEELRLSKLPNLKSICEDPRHRFTKLTELHIYKCPKLSCVFTQGMIQHMPNLEVLVVSACEGIEEIVMREDVEETNHPHLQLIFFPKLRTLDLHSCPKLSCVFTQGMIQHMPNLEELQVENCEGIEEIVMREDVEETNHPHLVRIWKGVSQPWPSIQEIQVYDCPNLKNLNLNAVDDQNPLAALRKIKGKREWWEALKWEDEESKHRLQPFFIPFAQVD